MIILYERNDSLWVSSGPDIAFQLHRVTRTENEHKNLLSSCHVTRLMTALQDKTMSDGSPPSTFRKSAIATWALLWLMYYRQWQWSRLIRVCGLQKLTQKLELCLNLEIVDVCSHFGRNCIRAYGDSVSVQSFMIACRILSCNLKIISSISHL